MARKQSPSTVSARKLAVAMASYWTRRDPVNPVRPNYDEAFRFVYSNSSPQGRRMVAAMIEGHNRDLNMVQMADLMTAAKAA